VCGAEAGAGAGDETVEISHLGLYTLV